MRTAGIKLLLLLAVVVGTLLGIGRPAHAICVDIVRPDREPAETIAKKRMAFEAVCLDDRGKNVTADTSFTWIFPDAREPDYNNPTLHRFMQEARYSVTVIGEYRGQDARDRVTVIVKPLIGRLQDPPPPELDFFARGYLGERFGAEVCDQTQVVVRHPTGDAAPLLVATFYMRAAGEQQWEEMPPGQMWGHWETEDGIDYVVASPETWLTAAGQNKEYEWKAEVFLEFGPPPMPPEQLETTVDDSWTPNNTVVKATGDDVILHHADDTSHTIAWNLTHHVGNGVDPDLTVTVTVQIYNLGGGGVTTLTKHNVKVGADSVNWDTWLPETNGIYTYRISADHDDPAGFCDDQDKSPRLTVSVDKFYYFWKDVQAGKLKGIVKYTLNRAAAEGL